MRKNSGLNAQEKLKGLAVGLAVTVTMGASGAHATPLVKMSPGAVCSSDMSTTTDYRAGRLNSSASTIDMVCPLLRDRFGVPIEVGIGALDQNISQDVCCSSRSANTSGGSFRFTATKCSTSTHTTSQVLFFDGPDLVYGWDYRWLQCSVPAVDSGRQSGITGLWLVEY